MQTTIDLPDDLHSRACAVARDKSWTLDEAVAFLVRRGLAGSEKRWIERDPLTGLMVAHGGPIVTSEDVKALEDED